MAKYNSTNERVKHQYFGFLKEAKRQSEASVDGCAKALDRFETYIPCVRLGRYVRFQWGSPRLSEWLARKQQ